MVIQPNPIALQSDRLSRRAKTSDARLALAAIQSSIVLFAPRVEALMKNFYLTAAIAVVPATSLASSLLWIMAFGPATIGLRSSLRSAFTELFGRSRLRAKDGRL
jgi:hypothetical protein